MKKKHNLGLTVLMLLLIAVMMAIIFKREWIYDYYRGITYQPSAEMMRIREDLQLTGEGEFYFNASQPVLSGREEFNERCRSVADTEVAVLGCYANGDIFIYNITDEELDGIRELTTAHELLHAVWARMDENEQERLQQELKQVLNENKSDLGEELNTYLSDERQEELYVRAGTEIKKLPDSLEKHYAKYFKDQDLVVGFYKKYIKVFKEIEAEMDKLKKETEELGATINAKIADYKNRLSNLQAEVAEFNNCAAKAGCFASEGVFYARRAVLIARQNELGTMVDEINGMVNTYNEKVKQYNQYVTRTEKLNDTINSYSKPEVIE